MAVGRYQPRSCWGWWGRWAKTPQRMRLELNCYVYHHHIHQQVWGAQSNKFTTHVAIPHVNFTMDDEGPSLRAMGQNPTEDEVVTQLLYHHHLHQHFWRAPPNVNFTLTNWGLNHRKRNYTCVCLLKLLQNKVLNLMLEADLDIIIMTMMIIITFDIIMIIIIIIIIIINIIIIVTGIEPDVGGRPGRERNNWVSRVSWAHEGEIWVGRPGSWSKVTNKQNKQTKTNKTNKQMQEKLNGRWRRPWSGPQVTNKQNKQNHTNKEDNHNGLSCYVMNVLGLDEFGPKG